MTRCVVRGCCSESYAGCLISFHSFPQDEELKQRWLSALGKKSVSKSGKVCHQHFRKEDYDYDAALMRRRKLKPHAVPSVYLDPGKGLTQIARRLLRSHTAKAPEAKDNAQDEKKPSILKSMLNQSRSDKVSKKTEIEELTNESASDGSVYSLPNESVSDGSVSPPSSPLLSSTNEEAPAPPLLSLSTTHNGNQLLLQIEPKINNKSDSDDDISEVSSIDLSDESEESEKEKNVAPSNQANKRMSTGQTIFKMPKVHIIDAALLQATKFGKVAPSNQANNPIKTVPTTFQVPKFVPIIDATSLQAPKLEPVVNTTTVPVPIKNTTLQAPMFEPAINTTIPVSRYDRRYKNQPEYLKKRVDFLANKVKVLNRRLRRAERAKPQKNILRVINKIDTGNPQQNMLDILKAVKKYTQHSEMENILNGSFKKLCALVNKNGVYVNYSDEVIKFAITLNYYSPKAYRFVRKHIPLPSAQMLQRYAEAGTYIINVDD